MLRRSKSHRGQGLAEYGLLIAMILGILVLVVPTIGAGYAYLNSAVGSTVNSAIGGGGGGNGGNPTATPTGGGNPTATPTDGGNPTATPTGGIPTPPPDTGGNPPIITDPTPLGGNLEEVTAEGFCANTPVSAFLDGTILLQSELTNNAWGDSVLSDGSGAVDMFVQLPSNLTPQSHHSISLSGMDCSQNPPSPFITPPDPFLVGGVFLDNLVVDACSDNFERTPTVDHGLGTPSDCAPSTWQDWAEGLGQGIVSFGPSNHAAYLEKNDTAELNTATGYPLHISFDAWISPIAGSNQYGHWSDGSQSISVVLGPLAPLSLTLGLNSAFGGVLTGSVTWAAQSNSHAIMDPQYPGSILPGTIVNYLTSPSDTAIDAHPDCTQLATMGACKFAVSIDITTSTMLIRVNGFIVNSTADYASQQIIDMWSNPLILIYDQGVNGTVLDPYNMGWSTDGTTEFGQADFTSDWSAGTYNQ